MKIKILLIAVLLFVVANANAQSVANRWSEAKANAWYAKHAWINGANFIPSTAVNQLEMWQADTFDPKTIDRELGWAEGIGFNTVRVFLHSLAWKQDQKGFISRVNQFLEIADKHHIQPIFVLFDDCWNDNPHVGKQPEPKPGMHNSGWMQDPGGIVTGDRQIEFLNLKGYVEAVIGTFRRDKRILLWDLYNEPGNSNKKEQSIPLLTKVFEWAHGVDPDQPVTAGFWDWSFDKLNQIQMANSDVITYHNYGPGNENLQIARVLKANNRPVICTEYMARPRNSTFENTMPLLKKANVGAINWGLVSGKTNTIYAWDTPIPDGSEPKIWFHDIFRKDGTPYKQDEVDFIKKINDKQ